MPVTIKNRGRTPFTVNLRRGASYGNDPRCAESVFRMDQPVELPNGERGINRIERTLPGSLTWQPGEVKRNLPDEVRNMPEIQRAMPRTLVVVE